MLNLPMSSVRKATVTTSEGNLAEFLLRSERKLRHAIPDGNCLFRSLSINLYNHQEEHLAIRKLLVKFEELNKDQFANYLTASDANNIDDHICSMVKSFVWGTQVELLAASSFFQVPLYYCQASQGTYRWYMLGPVNEAQKLRYPADNILASLGRSVHVVVSLRKSTTDTYLWGRPDSGCLTVVCTTVV